MDIREEMFLNIEILETGFCVPESQSDIAGVVQVVGILDGRVDILHAVDCSNNTKQLRELEADGFLLRHDFKEIPPRVECTLSDLGKSFIDVIDYMKTWRDQNLPDVNNYSNPTK